MQKGRLRRVVPISIKIKTSACIHNGNNFTEYKKFVKNFESPVPTREVSLIFHQSQLRDSFEKELINTIQSILRGKIFLEKDQKLDSNMVSLPKK